MLNFASFALAQFQLTHTHSLTHSIYQVCWGNSHNNETVTNFESAKAYIALLAMNMCLCLHDWVCECMCVCVLSMSRIMPSKVCNSTQNNWLKVPFIHMVRELMLMQLQKLVK